MLKWVSVRNLAIWIQDYSNLSVVHPEFKRQLDIKMVYSPLSHPSEQTVPSVGAITGGVIGILLCCIAVLVFVVVYLQRRKQHAVKLVISSKINCITML